ncbi:MAG: four helix bundle protein [Anaerolineae bacterium]
MDKPANYRTWEETVPEAIQADSLWKMKAYRLSLFAAELGWHDVTRLARDRRTRALADQLYRALGSVGANLAEGYSRGTGRDRARFYEYALGSARESRDWYYKGRHVLGPDVTEHRLDLLTEILRLLLTTIPQQRGRPIREEGGGYEVAGESEEAKLDEIPF